MSVFLAKRWKKQPDQLVQVDTSHPLAVGLGNAAFPRVLQSRRGYPNAILFSSAVPGFAPTTFVNQTGFIDEHGHAFGTNATSGSYQATINGNLANRMSTSGPGTVFAVVKAVEIPSSASKQGICRYTNSGWGPTLLRGDGTNDVWGGETNTSGSTIWGPSVEIGKLVTLAYSGRPNSQEFYFNGVLQGTVATAMPVTPGGPAILLSAASHHFYMVAGWSRALSGAEIRSLSENPWQIFRPQRRLSISVPSAATAPTLSAATVIDIGTTSARPRVTVTFS